VIIHAPIADVAAFGRKPHFNQRRSAETPLRQRSPIRSSITDGAYAAMMNAIRHDETPNFYFMQYELATWSVTNLLLVPHFAFPPSAIIKRKPLSSTARRAGWVGCNFALNRIPVEARIAIVTTILSPPQSSAGVSPAPGSNSSEGRRNACATLSRGERVVIATPAEVRAQFRRVKPLSEISVKQRGWTLDVLNAIRRLGKTDLSRLGNGERNLAESKGPRGPSERARASQFTTADAYAFTRELEQLHPGNPVNNRVTRGGPPRAGQNPPAASSLARHGIVTSSQSWRMEIAVTLNSQSSTINYFATSGVCREFN
jgi:hypothetical protein